MQAKDILFRVWDTDTKLMSEIFSIEWLLTGDKDLVFGEDETLPLSDFKFFREDFEWLRYTGREDRHGNLIFEGDVIKHGESIRFIEKQGCNWFATRTDKSETILLSFSKDPEVIGNIYENPKLLNQG